MAPLSVTAPRFAFTLRRLSEPATRTGDRIRDLELLLRHIGREVLAAGITIPAQEIPTLTSQPELAQLSSREWGGSGAAGRRQPVTSIAADLGVQPSTVRNHLSSIFTKLNVRSQAELLDYMRTAVAQPSG